MVQTTLLNKIQWQSRGLRGDSESPPFPPGSIGSESLQHLASYHCSIHGDSVFSPHVFLALEGEGQQRARAVMQLLQQHPCAVMSYHTVSVSGALSHILFDYVPKDTQVLVWHILL